MKDGNSAIRWIRTNATSLGIDPKQVIAGGGSAGGHVAAAAGTLSGFEEENEDLRISSRPDALVLFNPVFDNGPGGYGHARVQDYWQEFSPMHNITETTPPMIVFLGTEDRLIPVDTAQRFKELKQEKHRRCDLHLYEGEGHGFFNHRNTANYLDTMIKTDRFLTSLGYLEGEPTRKTPEESSASPQP